MSESIEFLPFRVTAMIADDGRDYFVRVGKYCLFIDHPEGLDDCVIDWFSGAEDTATDVVCKIESYIDERIAGKNEVNFWTVWEVTVEHEPATWVSGEEWGVYVDCLGVADSAKWTPESLGLIQ